jgi:hypothetical protein
VTEAAVLTWIENTWLGELTRGVPWMFAALETIHFIGLCILFGAVCVFDLRLLGWARAIPLGQAMKFIRLAIVGLLLNLVSGIALFSADPFNYWPNPTFQLKLFLIVAAGLNALWFELTERRKLEALPTGAAVDTQGKVIAAASLALWTAVILLGRLLPYVGGAGG